MLRTRADRAVETTLLFALAVHLVALLTMAGILLPGMPGAGLQTPGLRSAYIAAHPFLWHFGWLPWHLSAVSDLAFSAALLAARWIPRRASVPTFVLTLIPFAIEQYYETLWDIYAPRFTAAASPLLHDASYAAFEHRVFLAVCVVAAILYAFMAVGWSWCVSFSPGWTRWLTALSCVAWPVLLVAATAPLLRLPQILVNVANQAGFSLLMVWFVLALEAVLRRTRTAEPWGGMAAWRAPGHGFSGWLFETLANSRLLRYIAEFFPAVLLASDIQNVVYINYLVEADKLSPLLPEGLQLQLLGGDGRYTLLTVLTYQHGGFGPTILHGLRRALMPSPRQSNWRVYVREPLSGVEGIYFISTAISNTMTALLGRMISYCVPMHRPAELNVAVEPDGNIRIRLDSGGSSAPDLDAEFTPAPIQDQPWPQDGPWSHCFAGFSDFLAYCVPQERALAVRSWDRRITSQEIALETSSDTCRRLAGVVRSPALLPLCGEAEPICFLLPRVGFTMLEERTIQPSQLTGSTLY